MQVTVSSLVAAASEGKAIRVSMMLDSRPELIDQATGIAEKYPPATSR